jgi:DNA-binding winged helix-turn-helix (wHTH) protein/tetratricopeptide (TPR) repeat protein
MKGMTAHAYRFGEFRLDLATRSLCWAGSEIALPPKALDCLGYLVQNADRAVGRDELIAAVWGRVDISDNALGHAILQTRRALRVGTDASAIRTVPRFGYHWQLPVTIVDACTVVNTPADAHGPIVARTDCAPAAAYAGDLPSAVPARLQQTDATVPGTGIRHAPHRPGMPHLAWLAVAVMALPLGPASSTGAGGGWEAPVRTHGARTRAAHMGTADPAITNRGASAAPSSVHANHYAQAGAAASSEGWMARLAAIESALVSGRVDDARAELGRMDSADLERPDVRYQLARLDFMQGRLDAAQDQFERLLQEPATDRQPLLRARIFNALGNLAYVRHDAEQVLANSSAAIDALAGHEAPAELGRAWVGRASAHTSLRQYDDALADYARARVAFSEAGDRLALARVDAYQGLLELTRGRPADALPMLAGAADRLQHFEAVIEELHARVGLVYVYLALSRPGAAHSQDARLAELSARVDDVRRRHYADFARVRGLMATGRLDAADALLDSLRTTLASRPEALLENNRLDLPVLATRLALARDDVAPALPDALQALSMADEDAGDRAMVQLMNWQLQVRLGRFDRARRIARAADRDDAGMDPVTRIRLALMRAGQAELDGDVAAARIDFDRALVLADNYRVPAELVEVARPFVRFLLTQRDHAYASVVAGRVAGWAPVDYSAALVQVELYGALEQGRAWSAALQHARSLAGERRIPPALAIVPGSQAAAGPGR